MCGGGWIARERHLPEPCASPKRDGAAHSSPHRCTLDQQLRWECSARHCLQHDGLPAGPSRQSALCPVRRSELRMGMGQAGARPLVCWVLWGWLAGLCCFECNLAPACLPCPTPAKCTLLALHNKLAVRTPSSARRTSNPAMVDCLLSGRPVPLNFATGFAFHPPHPPALNPPCFLRVQATKQRPLCEDRAGERQRASKRAGPGCGGNFPVAGENWMVFGRWALVRERDTHPRLLQGCRRHHALLFGPP